MDLESFAVMNVDSVPVVLAPISLALNAITHKKWLSLHKDSESLADGIIYIVKNGKPFKEKAKQTDFKMYEFDVMYDNYPKKKLENKSN